MSLLSRLFGGGSTARPTVQPEDHNGFSIYAEPIKEGGSWRLCARIEREIGGAVKSQRMIRADTFQSQEQAMKESLAKARMLIDQQGESLFDGP